MGTLPTTSQIARFLCANVLCGKLPAVGGLGHLTPPPAVEEGTYSKLAYVLHWLPVQPSSNGNPTSMTTRKFYIVLKLRYAQLSGSGTDQLADSPFPWRSYGIN